MDGFEEKITNLMKNVLFDKKLNLLREHFDPQGNPHPQKGHLVEAGHQFEWYWLIRGGAKKAYSQELAPLVGKMYEWGVAHGLDRKNGGVYDVCDVDGRVLQSTKRIWSTTEFIRAAACRWKKEGDVNALVLMNEQLKVLLEKFFRPNGWNESLNEDMKPNRSDMPVSTSYHISTCYFDSAALFQ